MLVKENSLKYQKLSKYYENDSRVKAKFLKAGFSRKVIENIESIIHNCNDIDEELMIPKWFFIEKKAVLISLPLLNKKERFPKSIIQMVKYGMT